MSTPNPDKQKSLREALQRDAARVKEPPFDPALHHATMRRIRALSDAPCPEWKWVFACAGVLVLGAITAFWPAGPSVPEAELAAHASSRPAQASAWAYRHAAAQGDEALLAMLEHDARTLLPASPAIYVN